MENTENRSQNEFIEKPTRLLDFKELQKDQVLNRHPSLIPTEIIDSFKNEMTTEEEIRMSENKIEALSHQFSIDHNFNTEQEMIMSSAFRKVKDEIENGFPPKIVVDFNTGDAFVEYFPIANAMEKIGIRPAPSGVSICLVSINNEVLSFQRSIKNSVCKGFIGPVAGYMSEDLQAKTTDELILSEVMEQLRHEIGLDPGDLDLGLSGLAEIDYPVKKSEVLVTALSPLSKGEIMDKVAKAKDQGLTKLAENNAVWIKVDKLMEIFSDPDCHVATQHALALALPLKDTQQWPQIIEVIKNIPKHSITEPWEGLPQLLKKHGVECENLK